MKTAVLISGLLLLLVANLVMVYFAPYGLSAREAFQNVAANNSANSANNTTGGADATSNNSTANQANNAANNAAPANNSGNISGNTAANNSGNALTEGFASYFLENAGGSKESYGAIGPYDGVKLSTGNSVSGWRYTAPNEPLNGAEFKPGPDSLFIFKNNQCKPECCGASFSCDGGCVCTTPQQRQYIASRGGNRTGPEDSA